MSLSIKFNYNQSAPFEIREVNTQNNEGVLIKDFTYINPFQKRLAAYHVKSEKSSKPMPAILYVHWYEPAAPDSNRTQFLEEAQEMAKRGATSLLVETMWSDRDWFIKRNQEEDYKSSVQQTIELRQAMDLLLSIPDVDPDNFAYVGHDFGAMYGVVMGAVDPRPKYYVLMAGTPRFPDWFLYYPNLTGDQRQDFMDSFVDIDPISLVSNLSPASVLFQFGDDDPHVTKGRGDEFFSAASEPKEIRWYQAGHGLNKQSADERINWLSEKLRLV